MVLGIGQCTILYYYYVFDVISLILEHRGSQSHRLKKKPAVFGVVLSFPRCRLYCPSDMTKVHTICDENDVVLYLAYHNSRKPMPGFKVDDRVSCKARCFGIQWARTNYKKQWKVARVHGVVHQILGPNQYKVLYDGDKDPLESSGGDLKVSRKRKKRGAKPVAAKANVLVPPVAAPGQPFVFSWLFPCQQARTFIGRVLCCMQQPLWSRSRPLTPLP